MQEKQSFTIQSLITILVVNIILLGVIYYLAGGVWNNQWLISLIAGLVLTLVSWGIVQMLGRRAIDSAATSAAAAEAARLREAKQRETPAAQRPQAPPKPVAPPPPSDGPAIQMLAILQRQGRLIDFLQEDLGLYDDAQIGAAVRSIHEGCKQALTEHVKLEPIYQEPEGSAVVLQPGFDPNAVRLTGNVVGNPPFRGELRHRGWRVAKITLPQRVDGQAQALIVAPAEVEVNG
ncbi:MAG: DUF2760 domain-containing protein [Caldilineaceae bacterium]